MRDLSHPRGLDTIQFINEVGIEELAKGINVSWKNCMDLDAVQGKS